MHLFDNGHHERPWRDAGLQAVPYGGFSGKAEASSLPPKLSRITVQLL